MLFFDFADNVRSMVTDDLKAAESERKPQQATIYHYTDVKGALGILESGEFWFAERTHLNDTAEMMYGLRIARELFDRSAKTRNPPIPEVEGFRLRNYPLDARIRFGAGIHMGLRARFATPPHR
jgi:hypothetical protein